MHTVVTMRFNLIGIRNTQCRLQLPLRGDIIFIMINRIKHIKAFHAFVKANNVFL